MNSHLHIFINFHSDWIFFKVHIFTNEIKQARLTLNCELGLFSQLTPTILGSCVLEVVMLLLLLIFSELALIFFSSIPGVSLSIAASIRLEMVILRMDLDAVFGGETVFRFKWSSDISSRRCFAAGPQCPR